MKIAPILIGLILFISFIPIALGGSSDVRPCTSAADCPDLTTRADSSDSKASSPGGRGDGCITRLGSDGQKLDVSGSPFLTDINAVETGNIKFTVLSNPAPAGKIWKAMIIDAKYCFAWNPETRKILKEISMTPIEDDNHILPMMWWHPNNKDLW